MKYRYPVIVAFLFVGSATDRESCSAVRPDGQLDDGHTTIIYHEATGEVALDADALTGIRIESMDGVFTGEPADHLDRTSASFDFDTDSVIFKSDFEGGIGSLSFGQVAQPFLTRTFLLNDLNVEGALKGGGGFFDADLIYQPLLPNVTDVFLRGRGWTPEFLAYLSAQGLGDSTFGFRIPDGARQLDVLSWADIHQVSIRFVKPVEVAVADLQVKGLDVSEYALDVTAFSYDSATSTATWTLDDAEPSLSLFAADKVRLVLDGGQGGVQDANGENLDGDWQDGDGSFPSGDTEAGGDFSFLVHVLPGDATRDGRTDIGDLVNIATRVPAQPPDAKYEPQFDVNGDLRIDIGDLVNTATRVPGELPPGELIAALTATNSNGVIDFFDHGHDNSLFPTVSDGSRGVTLLANVAQAERDQHSLLIELAARGPVDDVNRGVMDPRDVAVPEPSTRALVWLGLWSVIAYAGRYIGLTIQRTGRGHTSQPFH